MINVQAPFLLLVHLALVASATQAGVWNAGECTGQILNAASHVAGAGLQIAVATGHCGEHGADNDNPDQDPARCAFDVTVSMRSMFRATRLLTQASGSCGGQASPCGVAIENAAGFLSGTVKYGTETEINYSEDNLDHARKDLELMGSAINFAIRSMTDAGVACKNSSSPAGATDTGYCISELFNAGTVAAAASMEIMASQVSCSKDNHAMCAATVSASAMDLMGVGVHLTTAAQYCGPGSSTACALSIEKVLMLASAAAAMGAEAKVYNKAGDLEKVREKVELTGTSTASMVAEMGASATACTPNNGNPGAALTAKCVSDTISAATYLADGTLAIAVSMKDCAAAKEGGKVHKCASDVFKSLQAFSKTASSLVLAADDCESGSLFTPDCGTDIAGALTSLETAAQLGADMKSATSARYDAFLRGERGQDNEESIGDSMENFALAMDKAAKNCKRTTSAASALFAEESPVEIPSWLSTTFFVAVIGSAVVGTAAFVVRRRLRRRAVTSAQPDDSDEGLMGGNE